MITDLGSYRPDGDGNPKPGPFNNYRDPVIFDNGPKSLAKRARFDRLRPRLDV